MNTNTEDRKILKVTREAAEALDILKQLLQEERKGSDVSKLDAASFAILELTERKQKAKARRLANVKVRRQQQRQALAA